MAASREGSGTIQLSTSATSTGASTWHQLRGSLGHFALQVVYSTGSTAVTVQLQGALTTGTTAPTTIISYTQATASGTIVQSTGTQVFSYIRSNVSTLSTSTGSTTTAITGIHAAATP